MKAKVGSVKMWIAIRKGVVSVLSNITFSKFVFWFARIMAILAPISSGCALSHFTSGTAADIVCWLFFGFYAVIAPWFVTIVLGALPLARKFKYNFHINSRFAVPYTSLVMFGVWALLNLVHSCSSLLSFIVLIVKGVGITTGIIFMLMLIVGLCFAPIKR